MSRLSKNITYNFLGQILLLVVGLIAVKYVFRQLGEDALGIIYFTLALNGVLCAALDMGVSSTTVREISATLTSEPRYIHDFIRTASSMYWAAYLIAAVLVYCVAPVLVQKWIHLQALDVTSALAAFRILAISALTVLPRSLYASLFRGLQRMEFTNIIDVATSVLQQCGTIVILAHGGGLLQIVQWFALCFTGSILCYVLLSARFLSWRSLVPGYRSYVVRRNASFARNMTSVSLLGMVQTQSDKMIVSKLLPIGISGYYGFASGMVSKAMLLTGAIAQAAFPSFAALYRTGDRVRVLAQYRKLHDLVCIATVPIFAGLTFAALPLFTYAFNAAVARMLLVPVAWLCLGFYLSGVLNIPFVVSLAAGKPGIWARCNLWALYIVIPLSVTLVIYFGLAGAGFSWVLYHVFAYGYAVRRVCSECLGISVWAWFGHLALILGLVLVTYGLSWLLTGAIGGHTLNALVIGYVSATVAFVAIAYWIAGVELKESLRHGAEAFWRPREIGLNVVASQ